MRGAIPHRDQVESDAEASGAAREHAPAETDPIEDGTALSPSAASDVTGGPDSHEPDADTDEIPLTPNADPTAHRAHHRRPVGLIITVAVLTALLIGTSTLAAYLWHISEEWEQQVADITEISYGLGDDVAAARDALTAAEEQITLLSDQLATAKDSVTRLQAENAQWGDDAAFAQEEITLLESKLAEGTAVSTSLVRCIEAHDQLLTYVDALESAQDEPAGGTPPNTTTETVDAGEVASYRESVVDLCTAARTASQAFQQSVAP